MTYYKVKSECDGRQLWLKPGQRGYSNVARVPNGHSLIANELFTARELDRLNVPQQCIDVVNISKRAIFWMFGARFECKEKVTQ